MTKATKVGVSNEICPVIKARIRILHCVEGALGSSLEVLSLWETKLKTNNTLKTVIGYLSLNKGKMDGAAYWTKHKLWSCYSKYIICS